MEELMGLMQPESGKEVQLEIMSGGDDGTKAEN